MIKNKNYPFKINLIEYECYGEVKLKSKGKFKDFVLTRNLPECKKFISYYVKEVIVYRDHIEVIFNVVFSFVHNEITHDLHITTVI